MSLMMMSPHLSEAAGGLLPDYGRRCKIPAPEVSASPFCLTSNIPGDRFRGSGGKPLYVAFPLGLGDVAQLGERRNGIAEVRGSIPLVSTESLV